jgi:HAD superfamily hydrolase (TIGR01509 family)
MSREVATMTPLELVIFDCDGVLVDSEPLAMRVLLEGLAEVGCRLDEAIAYERFLGRSLATVQAIVRDELGLGLTNEQIERMRERLFDLFRRELRPMPGIAAALKALPMPRCVASSSQPERITLSLEVTGLLPRFAPHLFSAAMVDRGKPAPDLFLHAATCMAVRPETCLVIEDSPAGIEAARRAGMAVFGFTGGSHARGAAHRARLEALAPDLIFDDMHALPGLVRDRRPPPAQGG